MLKLKLEDRRRPWLPPLLLLIVSLLVFSPVIFGGGFFWDDYPLIVDNPAIHAANGLCTIWFSTRLPDYFPLTSTLFWIEWRLFGRDAPAAYHLVNVLLHAGTAILLWRLLRSLRIRGALLAALLFAVHPVNAESAAWIAEGKNTLSLCLAMAAMLLWVRSESRGSGRLYAGALALFLLALAAKTSVVMAPVAMVILLWYRRRATWPALLRTVPFFLLSAALGAVTMWFQAHNSIADTPIRDDNFASRLAVAGWSVWWYLGKALLPVNITFAYPTDGWRNAARFGAIAFVPAALLVLLAAVLWGLRKKIGRGWLAALVIYVAMLLPILGFVNVFFMRYSLVSNHWQYAAMPAFCAVAGAAIVWIARHGSVARWNGVLAGALGVLALLAVDSSTVAAVYRTQKGVWQDLVAHDPQSWLGNVRLGEMALEFARAGHPEAAQEAMVFLRRVVDTRPDLAIGYLDLGNAYIAEGLPGEAMKLYKQGLQATGNSSEKAGLHASLGGLLGNKGDDAGAKAQFEAALAAAPRSAIAQTAWGKYCILHGDKAGAKAAWEAAAEDDGKAIEPRLYLAELLSGMGDQAGALKYAEEAFDIDPQDPRAIMWMRRLESENKFTGEPLPAK